MSSTTGTTVAVAVTDAGVTIGANPNRSSILIQNSTGSDTLYVFLGAFTDLDIAESIEVPVGAALGFDGYLGQVHLACDTAATADARVMEIHI